MQNGSKEQLTSDSGQLGLSWILRSLGGPGQNLKPEWEYREYQLWLNFNYYE